MEHRLLSNPARLAGQSLLRMQSDARLTELARAGHGPAFDAIVARYRPSLVRYCTRILGPDRAEDAVQQALAGAHAALTAPDDRPIDLRPWLYRVAHNAALNQLRASRQAAEAEEPDVAGGMAPDEVLAQREELDALVRAIETLPRGQRDALLLRELEGRSHEEIAEALGVSRGAARQQLFRARAAVRAACSALTPLPLLTRLIEAGAGPVAAGGGDLTGHALAKGVAGVLAVTAVAGGAVAGDRPGSAPPQPQATGDVKAAVAEAPAPRAPRGTSTSASVGAPTATPRAVTFVRAPASPARDGLRLRAGLRRRALGSIGREERVTRAGGVGRDGAVRRPPRPVEQERGRSEEQTGHPGPHQVGAAPRPVGLEPQRTQPGRARSERADSRPTGEGAAGDHSSRPVDEGVPGQRRSRPDRGAGQRGSEGPNRAEQDGAPFSARVRSGDRGEPARSSEDDGQDASGEHGASSRRGTEERSAIADESAPEPPPAGDDVPAPAGED